VNLALPADIYTPDQLSMCIQELRGLISARRDLAAKSRVGNTPETTPAVPPFTASLLQANRLSGSTAKELEELVKALESLRLKAPVVHLTLAALPGPKLSVKLVEWFRREIHPSTLLLFVMDHTIGGGVVIRVGSRVYDFSFSSQLVRHKNRIAEISARV